MKKRINYGDNLFLLTLILKDLTAAARLNVDPDIFLDKLVEDIFFLDSTIASIHEQLSANPHLLDRLEHMKSLQNVSQAFGRLLGDLRGRRLPLGEHLAHFDEKFELLRQTQDGIVRATSRVIQEASASPPEESRAVSEEELRLLLTGGEEVCAEEEPAEDE